MNSEIKLDNIKTCQVTLITDDDRVLVGVCDNNGLLKVIVNLMTFAELDTTKFEMAPVSEYIVKNEE